MFAILRDTLSEFSNDECPRMAAAMAYYTIFALPAMLVLIVSIAGLFVDRAAVTERLTAHVTETMGEKGASQVKTMLQQRRESNEGLWGSIISTAVLLFGATGMLAELQTALNRAWGVEADSKQGGVRTFVVKRLLSLSLLLAITFLLLVSLVISTVLATFRETLNDAMPAWISGNVMWTVNELVSLAIFTLLFAAILKIVPDARLSWTDVWIGAFVTALLFMVGKFGLGLYLSWSRPASAFGAAAGSLALILLWVYYSSMILFLGAEFTQVLARSRGRRVVPEEGAMVTGNAAKPAA